MARLKAKVTQSTFGYVGSVIRPNGEIWYRVYSTRVAQSTVIADFKDKLKRKFFKRV